MCVSCRKKNYTVAGISKDRHYTIITGLSARELSRQRERNTLAILHASDDVESAAEKLGMNRQSLLRYMRRHKIDKAEIGKHSSNR